MIFTTKDLSLSTIFKPIPPKDMFPDASNYRQHRREILSQVLPDFLAQNPQNQTLLSPKILLEIPTQNPTNLTTPYWQWLIRHNISAYNLTLVTNSHELKPLWSMGRMGQSTTLLPDGGEILIGGEFEDGYDPMFWIYNDVIVKYPNENIEIFGYPRHIFAPTDFHTATLVGENIWIIGSAGYPDERQFSQTSVYKLNIHTYKIEKVETRNSMGWVFKHSATLKDNQIIITGGDVLLGEGLPMVENIDDWVLNLKTLIWKNISKKEWQIFYVQRKDNQSLHLSNFEQLIAIKNHNSEEYQNEFEKLTEALNCSPNLTIYYELFLPPICHKIDESEQEYNTVTIFIEGIKIRYINDDDNIQVYIEGILVPKTLKILQENVCHKLSKLENFACEVKEPIL